MADTIKIRVTPIVNKINVRVKEGGIKGDKGDAPIAEWSGTSLGFDGDPKVDLKGATGNAGTTDHLLLQNKGVKTHTQIDTDLTTLQSEQTTQNSAIALNTAKVGITPTQASDITANNAKISYTDAVKVSNITITQPVNLDTLESDVAASKTKTDFLTVTQAVDLDAIEIRVNELDAAVILKGAWDASLGTFPGAGLAQAGWSYQVTVAGTVDGIQFSINDRIIALINNASTTIYAPNWLKADYSDLVSSFNARTGAIVLLNTDVSDLITAQTEKITTVDADTMPLLDSATTFGLKKITWANIKATLKTYFDTLFISGSGTQNYLLKFGVDGKSVVNSQIFDNGTKIGIGINPPLHKLHIKDTGCEFAVENTIATSRAAFFLKLVDGSRAGFFYYDSSYVDTFYRKNLRIYLDGGGDVIFDNANKFGIGINQPLERLHVNGNGKFTGSVQVGDNTAVASATNVGARRYRETANNSYVDICMKTSSTTYAWINIVTQTW